MKISKMIKKPALFFCSILTIISCTKTEIITIEEEITGIENHKIPVTEMMRSLKAANDGIIIGDDTVTFTKDYTIPRDSILNFYEKNRFIIAGNTTLTIDGIIAAGNYQIFEVNDTGKITGCPQVEHTNPIWFGVDETGIQPVSDLFQMAVEAFPCVKKFVANGKFLVDQEILLNVDNRYYDFTGSYFESPSFCTNVGGLITIGSRDYTNDPNSEFYITTAEYTVVENVTINGGFYKTNNRLDNVFGILHSKNTKISNTNINCEIGQRGIALQISPKNEFKPGASIPSIENVIIKNIVQKGGVNLFNIDIPYGIVKNIVVNDVIGTSINNQRWIPVAGSTIDCDIVSTQKEEAAFRISSQVGAVESDQKLRVENLLISNVILDNIYKGFTLNGADATLSDIEINNVFRIGIELQFPEVVNINNVKIEGSSITTDGIILGQTSSKFKNVTNFENITLIGKFRRGIWNFVNDVSYNNVSITGEFEFGVHNQASNVSFQDLNITTPIGIVNHAAIYNKADPGTSNVFSGRITGNYAYGIINGAQKCNFDFEIKGSFTGSAIYSFESGLGYSSRYKAYMNLSGNQSKPINAYRSGDTYEIYVYNETTGAYILNPPIN